MEDLGRLLRQLRRRHARARGTAELTYREIAAGTGWSHGIVGEYLSGRVLPPTDRFDTLVRLFGATPAEQGALATARDRVEEARRPAIRRAVPRQLPPQAYPFVGRAAAWEALDATLADPRPVVVAGTAGVGKTALAVRWAYSVADRFPDGQLYVDLRGYDAGAPVPPADALAAFLRACGVRPEEIPADAGERAARWRTELADRRVLVLLDNACAADQVRPLLPGGAHCRVVVTSRDDLPGLVARDGARRVPLDVLSEEEAVALLRSLVDERLTRHDAAELAACCARLPLALRVAAARADRPLAALVAGFRAGSGLDLLDPGDPRAAVRTVFSWSRARLSPAAARLFGLVGLHPGTSFDVYAAAALGDLTVAGAHTALAELAGAHLVEPGFTLHDLLRAYAAETAPPEEVRPALTRLFDHYTATAVHAARTLFPHDPPVPWTATENERPLGVRDDARQWCDEQRANLVAAARYAARHGWPRHSVALSRALWRVFEVGGHLQEALAVHGAAAGVAPQDAEVLTNLGGAHGWLGDLAQARALYERALGAGGGARTTGRLALVCERQGRYAEAADHMTAALALHRADGDRYGEAGQLLNLGTVHRRRGRYAEAAAHHHRAAELFAALGEVRLEGYALGNLGAVESLLGEHDAALAHLTRALEQCEAAGDRAGVGSALTTLGTVHTRRGAYAEALELLRRGLSVSRETADRSLETETLNGLGEVLLATGRYAEAVDAHREALGWAERTGDRFEGARAAEGLGSAYAGLGDRTRAAGWWSAGLAGYAGLGVPEADRVRALLSGSAGGRAEEEAG